jgi:glycosyltransferase involved in cell wall biosynthesis
MKPKMDQPKISIIIPVYNSNETLRTAVLSAIEQTYSNTELIIIDDGSTQNCLDVLDEFAGKFQYIKQSNQGASSARNTGANVSTGSYLAFLDADDSWHPQKLELQMQVKDHGYNFDVCYCDSSDATRAHRELLKLDEHQIKSMSIDDVFANPFFGLPNVIISKNTFDEISGFDKNLITAEDIDLYLKAAKMNKLIIHLKMKLMFRLRRENSLSSHIRSYTDFADVIMRHAQEADASLSVVNNTLRKNYREMAKSCLWRNNLSGFRHSIFKLISMNAYTDALMLSIRLPFSLLKRALVR